MKRFRSRHSIQKQVMSMKSFVCNQGSLLALLCLVLIGVFFGVSVFRLLNDEHRSFFSEFFYKPIVLSGWKSVFSAVVGSSLRHSLLLVLLFLFGLTAFGCPLILCTVLLFGFRVGVIVSISYVTFGGWHTAIIVYLPLLIVGIGMLLAVKSSFYMSCVFSRQLLPSGAHCGGLWMEFKRYLASYVLCFGLVVMSSIAEVLLQVIKSMM